MSKEGEVGAKIKVKEVNEAKTPRGVEMTRAAANKNMKVCALC
jgi:hypothetical protein